MIKYNFYIFIFFVVFLFSLSYIKAKTNQIPLFGKVIYIDIGHGGSDPGAMYGGVLEKNINLEIGKKLEQKLTNLGAIVYLTRYDDYDLSVTYTVNNKRSDLSRRSNLINKSNCDLFISIHLNAEESGLWKGAQVFYNSKNDINEEIASIFEKHFKKELNSTRNKKIDNTLYLLKRIERPGVLLEVGFLSNANDRYLLKQASYQNKISDVISNAIINYFNKLSVKIF